MNLNELKQKLTKIKKMGYIKTHRHGDTGIGKTLEDLLEIKENNISLPDFGIMELKSQRINTGSMITLFTKSPEGIANAEIREKFGYKDKEFPNIKCLRQTIDDGRKNAMGFDCEINEKSTKMIVKKDDDIIGFYSLNFLKKKAIEKVGDGLILVLAETKKKNNKEFFYYKEAFILKNIDPVKFLSHSRYDIRLGVYRTGEYRGKKHDHGSAFRIPQKHVIDIFKIKQKIL